VRSGLRKWVVAACSGEKSCQQARSLSYFI